MSAFYIQADRTILVGIMTATVHKQTNSTIHVKVRFCQ